MKQENRNAELSFSKYAHPGLFYGVAIIVPWVCWLILAKISHSLAWSNPTVVFWGSILGIVGLCGPCLMAMRLILPDRDMRRELRSALFNFRGIKAGYWLLTLCLFPASILLAMAISLLFGHSAEQFHFVKHLSFTAGIFPAWFLLVIAPIIEELGWHTYGIHCLRSRFNLFVTSLIFGLVWGFWHAPLSLVKDYYQNVVVTEGAIYAANFLVSLIPYVLIANWLYYKTHRNMLLVVAFHLLAGFSNEIFQTHPDSKVIQTVLLLILAAAIVVREKRLFFCSKTTQTSLSSSPPKPHH